MRSTYTYATMEVSRTAYEEIRAKLEAADYQQAIHEDRDGEVLDMRGIALVAAEPESAEEDSKQG